MLLSFWTKMKTLILNSLILLKQLILQWLSIFVICFKKAGKSLLTSHKLQVCFLFSFCDMLFLQKQQLEENIKLEYTRLKWVIFVPVY